MKESSIREQSVVVRLPADLVRRAKALTGTTAAYRDLAELVELALLNQLELDEGDTRAASSSQRAPKGGDVPREEKPSPELSAVLRAPSTQPPTLGQPVSSGIAALSPFTNRLFPVKVCCRVLANLPDTDLPEFQRTAAEAARALGLRLKAEDADARRHGLDRRWVALPVGGKGRATTNRFINHFCLTLTRAGAPTGPMADLGLAAMAEDGRPALTTAGAELASAANPVLDEHAAGPVLAEEERRLMLAAIAASSAERAAVLRFADIVGANGAIQERVDAAIPAEFGTSSGAQATALRAAMVGRLHDLGLVEVSGSGPQAQIRMKDDALIGLREEEQQ